MDCIGCLTKRSEGEKDGESNKANNKNNNRYKTLKWNASKPISLRQSARTAGIERVDTVSLLIKRAKQGAMGMPTQEK